MGSRDRGGAPRRLLEDPEVRLDLPKCREPDTIVTAGHHGDDPETGVRVPRVLLVLDARATAGTLAAVGVLDRGGVERGFVLATPTDRLVAVSAIPESLVCELILRHPAGRPL